MTQLIEEVLVTAKVYRNPIRRTILYEKEEQQLLENRSALSAFVGEGSCSRHRRTLRVDVSEETLSDGASQALYLCVLATV